MKYNEVDKWTSWLLKKGLTGSPVMTPKTEKISSTAAEAYDIASGELL
jgi:hypothetical protein